MKKSMIVFLICSVLLIGCGNKAPDAGAAHEASATVSTAETAATEISATVSSAAEEVNKETDQNSESVSSDENASEGSKSDSADKNAGDKVAKSGEKDSTGSDTANNSEKGQASDKKADQTGDKQDTQTKETPADKTAQDSQPKEAPAEQPAQETQPQADPQPETQPQPQKIDYGRIVYTGDSRSVDMFNGGIEEIWDGTFNGIRVFCKDACQSDYMINAVNCVGWENFDTLVSWMGCNDYGNFAPYESFYNTVLSHGKHLILCTVGPTDDATLANDFDRGHYTNDLQIAYNASLVNWANNNGVKVIDLYSYIVSNQDIYIDPVDGIHYQPQPTTAIWNFILSLLDK
jgi:hypothetical protein